MLRSFLVGINSIRVRRLVALFPKPLFLGTRRRPRTPLTLCIVILHEGGFEPDGSVSALHGRGSSFGQAARLRQFAIAGQTDAVAALNRRIVQRHHKGIPRDQCAIDRFASAVHSKAVTISWLLEVKAHGRPATLSTIRCGWFRAS